MSELVMVQATDEEVTRFRQLADDSKWLTENYDQIKKDFGEEYVAVRKGWVMDHDEDLAKLRDRVKGALVVIRYIYREKPHLIL